MLGRWHFTGCNSVEDANPAGEIPCFREPCRQLRECKATFRIAVAVTVAAVPAQECGHRFRRFSMCCCCGQQEHKQQALTDQIVAEHRDIFGQGGLTCRRATDDNVSALRSTHLKRNEAAEFCQVTNGGFRTGTPHQKHAHELARHCKECCDWPGGLARRKPMQECAMFEGGNPLRLSHAVSCLRVRNRAMPRPVCRPACVRRHCGHSVGWHG